eukprot:3936798-Rhodomonas_salina.3
MGCYAMSGTDIGILCYLPTICYAMSGERAARSPEGRVSSYAPATKCPVLTCVRCYRPSTSLLRDVQYCEDDDGICLRACYAMSGTDLA